MCSRTSAAHAWNLIHSPMIEGTPLAAQKVWSAAKGVWLAIEGAWLSGVEVLQVALATGFPVRQHPRRVGGAVAQQHSVAAGEWEDWRRASVAESSCEGPSFATRLGASEEGGQCFVREPSNSPSACVPGSQRGQYIGGGGPLSSRFVAAGGASPGVAEHDAGPVFDGASLSFVCDDRMACAAPDSRAWLRLASYLLRPFPSLQVPIAVRWLRDALPSANGAFPSTAEDERSSLLRCEPVA